MGISFLFQAKLNKTDNSNFPILAPSKAALAGVTHSSYVCHLFQVWESALTSDENGDGDDEDVYNQSKTLKHVCICWLSSV